MTKSNQNKKRPVINPGEGPDLVLLAGLPKHTLSWVLSVLTKDPSTAHAKFVGAQSNKDDWTHIYRQATIEEIYRKITDSIRGGSGHASLTPRRILVLYIPSNDSHTLVAKLGISCYMEPLIPYSTNSSAYDGISWRHRRDSVETTVYHALQKAIVATNALQNEIGKKRMSPLTLPARNFYFPTRQSTIEGIYHDFIQRKVSCEELRNQISTTRFTRDDLPQQAFKGNQGSDRFYQDARSRIFPPTNMPTTDIPARPRPMQTVKPR